MNNTLTVAAVIAVMMFLAGCTGAAVEPKYHSLPGLVETVQPGKTQAEVKAELGAPPVTHRISGKFINRPDIKTVEVWIYLFAPKDRPKDHLGFQVNFIEGQVSGPPYLGPIKEFHPTSGGQYEKSKILPREVCQSMK